MHEKLQIVLLNHRDSHIGYALDCILILCRIALPDYAKWTRATRGTSGWRRIGKRKAVNVIYNGDVLRLFAIDRRRRTRRDASRNREAWHVHGLKKPAKRGKPPRICISTVFFCAFIITLQLRAQLRDVIVARRRQTIFLLLRAH